MQAAADRDSYTHTHTHTYTTHKKASSYTDTDSAKRLAITLTLTTVYLKFSCTSIHTHIPASYYYDALPQSIPWGRASKHAQNLQD